MQNEEEKSKIIGNDANRQFMGLDVYSFKMFFIDVLNEYVYSYIQENKMMLYDKQNPIYQKYLELFNAAAELETLENVDINARMNEIYADLMDLVAFVGNQRETGGRK